MKRLAREGLVTPIPRPKDMQYLYMPNPTMIHPSSTKTNHFLGLVDIYLKLKQPDIYEVEPDVCDEYRPDAYTRLDGEPILIEYQRSSLSNGKMQDKIQGFCESYIRKQHDAKTLWIITDHKFDIKIPTGFRVEIKKPDDL